MKDLKLNSIGFIGTGNMGSAMIKGIIRSRVAGPESIWIYDQSRSKMEQLNNELGVLMANSAEEVVHKCSIIVPAVKPAFIGSVMSEIRSALKSHHIILSIAAGVTINQLKELTQNKCYIIRTMPNTPALVGEGMTAVCKDPSVPDEYMNAACNILKSFGKVEFVTENQIHAATAISGSSPAYAFLFIEALADGGVMMGLCREQSYKMAAQALLGSAKMVLETGKHPGDLKDMVCSPSGTTIEAVASLENDGFRGAVINAVKVCAQKSIAMGDKNNEKS